MTFASRNYCYLSNCSAYRPNEALTLVKTDDNDPSV